MKEHFENLLKPTHPPCTIEAELEDDGGSTSVSLKDVFEVVKQLHGGEAPGINEIGAVWWLRITSLLFADDVVLMAPSVCDLQLSLDQITAVCEAAGMRISTLKSEAVVLSRKLVDCQHRVGNESLLQIKEFKYLGV